MDRQRRDGTSTYRSFRRDHEVRHDGHPTIPGSADPTFRGTPGRWNPEQLLVASLSQCHMLWFLHLAADAGVVVEAYRDDPVGEMELEADGAGQVTRVTLRPEVTVRGEDAVAAASALHAEANRMCFIARSVAFPVAHEPTTTAAG
ncbi:MAG: OsmC family protein [Iamia sp.]